MSVAKGRRQIVIVDRPAALAGGTADWRETSFVGETAALSYRVDRRRSGSWGCERSYRQREHRATIGRCEPSADAGKRFSDASVNRPYAWSSEFNEVPVGVPEVDANTAPFPCPFLFDSDAIRIKPGLPGR